jgi:hypothetical protein
VVQLVAVRGEDDVVDGHESDSLLAEHL